MQWDDLRYFLAVARTRKLKVAASQLGVDATTVGRRLERLALSLNTNLLETGPAGYSLTSSGEMLLRHAEEVERSVLTASGALTGERSRLAGTVRISLSEGFATWVLAPSLTRFKQMHPDIRIDIVSTNGFLNLSKREADLAIMLARPARGPLITRKLSDYRLGIYATSAYLQTHGTPRSIHELHTHRMVGYIPDFIYADELRYLSDIDEGLEPHFSSSSINVQHALARTGAGMAVLPHFIGKQDTGLQSVLAQEVDIGRSFWLVVHRDLRKVARIAAVIDWLDHLVREQATLLKGA
jgi:DNA-binding transcriptional LysR family regulator